MDFLKGRKTYIVAVLMIIVGLVEGLTGETGIVGFDWGGIWNNAQIILTGFGLAGLRKGIAG